MDENLHAYLRYLEERERSRSTREQYARSVEAFLRFVHGQPLSKELVIAYKRQLMGTCRSTSVNAKLAAVNGFLRFLGREELRVRPVPVQRQLFSPPERELTKAEYLRLVAAAQARRDPRLSLILQTLCATGIRVSELPYITAEAVAAGRAEVWLKGKSRVILIPESLRQMLLAYLADRGIPSGPVFVSRSGRSLERSDIWRSMKSLCGEAGVAPSKVFPHNLRHLFARCYYEASGDIAQLADILGHSSVNTTRIYLTATGQQHRRRMDTLGLVVPR